MIPQDDRMRDFAPTAVEAGRRIPESFLSRRARSPQADVAKAPLVGDFGLCFWCSALRIEPGKAKG
jgi:hypothetical protein